jgi:hypothetical protein
VRGHGEVEVRLQPLGAVEGVLRRAGQPQPGKMVQLVDPSYGYHSSAVSLDVAAFQAATDAAGRFRINHVPAGDFRLYLNSGVGPFTEETGVSVAAGALAMVIMGEPDPAGCTVMGRLKPSEALPVTDWRRHLTAHSLGRTLPIVEPPPGLSEEARQLWQVAWHQSAAGREQDRQRGSYTVEVAADGSFAVRGVLPGKYQLNLVALPEDDVRKNPWVQHAAAWKAYAIQAVSIPGNDPDSPAATSFDLGEVELKVERRKK